MLLLLVILACMIGSCDLLPKKGEERLEMTLGVSSRSGGSGNCADAVAEVISARLKQLGVESNDVQIRVEGSRVRLNLIHLTDADRTAKLVGRQGNIGFWETYENQEVFSYLEEANRQLLRLIPKKETSDGNDTPEGSLLEKFGTDTTAGADSRSMSLIEKNNPLFVSLSPAANDSGLFSGPVVGYTKQSDTAKVSGYLRKKEIVALFPSDLRFR
ncbi:MAG: hypothetical protein GC178_04285 [Flavobacteriales bacterium]|nr:hypothetical protein [Flavobacteriales bacterium]